MFLFFFLTLTRTLKSFILCIPTKHFDVDTELQDQTSYITQVIPSFGLNVFWDGSHKHSLFLNRLWTHSHHTSSNTLYIDIYIYIYIYLDTWAHTSKQHLWCHPLRLRLAQFHPAQLSPMNFELSPSVPHLPLCLFHSLLPVLWISLPRWRGSVPWLRHSVIVVSICHKHHGSLFFFLFCVLIGPRLRRPLTVCQPGLRCDNVHRHSLSHLLKKKKKFLHCTEAGNPPSPCSGPSPCLFHLLSLFAPLFLLFYLLLRRIFFFYFLPLSCKSSFLSNRLLSGHASEPSVISLYAFYLNFYISFCYHLLLDLPRSIYACCLWNW